MKHSIKGLFVILAIVMSFVLVQGVYAREDFETLTFKGVVTSDTSADDRTIGIDKDEDGETDVTIYHMGPSWYWDDVVGIPYPTVRDKVAIDAFYIDCLGVYVGVSVCYLDELKDDDCLDSIQLRDPATLKPLWNPNAKTTDLSDTAAEATGDGVKDYSHTYDNNWKETEEPAPHGKNDS